MFLLFSYDITPAQMEDTRETFDIVEFTLEGKKRSVTKIIKSLLHL